MPRRCRWPEDSPETCARDATKFFASGLGYCDEHYAAVLSLRRHYQGVIERLCPRCRHEIEAAEGDHSSAS